LLFHRPFFIILIASFMGVLLYTQSCVGWLTTKFWLCGFFPALALLGQGLKKSPIGQKLDFANHPYLCKGLYPLTCHLNSHIERPLYSTKKNQINAKNLTQTL
jgi:hypothetical protein